MAHFNPGNSVSDHNLDYRHAENLKQPPAPDARAALVVAHPGHELCVHGWLETARPVVFLLTDGSGHSGQTRVASMTEIITATGARPGTVYGRFADLTIYKALLAREVDLFVRITEELAEALALERIDYVTGDAIEGYNPIHDLCRLVINAAVQLVNRTGQTQVENFDFSLMRRPDACPENLRAGAIWFHLDDDAFTRKLTAMRAYPELADEVRAGLDGDRLELLRTYGALFEELEPLLRDLGTEAYRVECLRPARREGVDDFSLTGRIPFYERYGEKLAAAGRYQSVIRYEEHLRPVAEALGRISR